MHILVGTRNKGKIQAVQNALQKHPAFTQATIEGCDVSSGVSHQPIGLDETITGAKQRAKHAYDSSPADFAIGLESGIFPVPHTKSEYMDTTACAIFDGTTYHLGLSSCFEYPKALIEKVLQEGKEISQGALELGFSDNPSFGQEAGMVGILTDGVVPRVAYSEQAIHMALIHLLQAEHYPRD